jgi:deoxyhypusine synthase
LSSIYDDLRPFELDKVKTYPLASRTSKVKLDDFARAVGSEASLGEFLASLPNVLAVQSLRQIVERMRRARELQKPIIWGIGGHVIKTGLAPVIIDLLNHGFVSAIAANGSVLVHDAEIAMIGSTSEDVDATLSEGVFGGADETGRLLNNAARDGATDRIGLGEAVGRGLMAMTPRHKDYSLLCAAYDAKVPFTVHLTIGGDITHFHPSADGASLGATTQTDFRLLAEIVRRMDRGGVYLNVGSAVVKRFLSHRGFSPVIMIVPPHVIRDQSDGSGWRPLETTRRAKPAV